MRLIMQRSLTDDRLASLHTLGLVLYRQGRSEESEAIFRDCMRREAYVFGDMHPKVCFCQSHPVEAAETALAQKIYLKIAAADTSAQHRRFAPSIHYRWLP